MSSHPVLHSFHQNILKGIRVTEWTQNLFGTEQRDEISKVRKPVLSFLYATPQLVLFYISTKYHQNIPKSIQVTEWTRSFILTGSPHPWGQTGGGGGGGEGEGLGRKGRVGGGVGT